MIFHCLRSGIDVSDRDFDALYSRRIRHVSKFHFTPVEVAKKAAAFLVSRPGTRVLDIGAGAGKFCMIGAACTTGFFTGVEQRESLYQISDLLARYHRLPNLQFIHANILDIEFRHFDAVYFFNSFYENIFQNDPIDTSVRLDKALYAVYTQYVKEQLSEMPAGTRLATYFSHLEEIPENYTIVDADFDRKLKLWEKTA